MKATDKKKPIHTIPEGVWEGSDPAKNKEAKNNHKNPTASTDLQGNGYPANKQS